MARTESEHPTGLELQILKVLWDKSPLLVRDVRARLEDLRRPLAHSSVITMLNIMHRKVYLSRRKEGKSFWFSPKADRESVMSRMMGDMMSKLFDGSPSAMALNLLESAELDAEELSEIRKLIARKSRENKS